MVLQRSPQLATENRILGAHKISLMLLNLEDTCLSLAVANLKFSA